MVKYIHQEFVRSLEKVDWMDHKTKMRAIEKAKGISTRIGYAKEILNHTKVAELFHGVRSFSNQKRFHILHAGYRLFISSSWNVLSSNNLYLQLVHWVFFHLFHLLSLLFQLILKASATFYQNVQILRKYWTDYDIKKLREPYDKNE